MNTKQLLTGVAVTLIGLAVWELFLKDLLTK